MTQLNSEGYFPYKDTRCGAKAAASWDAGERLNLTALHRYPTFAFSISWFACGRARVFHKTLRKQLPHQQDTAGQSRTEQGCHVVENPQAKAANGSPINPSAFKAPKLAPVYDLNRQQLIELRTNHKKKKHTWEDNPLRFPSEFVLAWTFNVVVKHIQGF